MRGAAAVARTARSGRGAFRRWYGESPWQLLLLAASFAVTAYAGVRLLEGDTLGVLVWFAGAALLHDLVFLPLYSLADRLLRSLAGGGPPRLAGRYINHVRVPAVLSGLLLLVWLPLIAGPPAEYERVTGLPGGAGFALRWLLITVALFALSGLLLLGRTFRTTRTGSTGTRPARTRRAGTRPARTRRARTRRDPERRASRRARAHESEGEREGPE